MRMYNQLDELGFRYVDGKVIINKEERDERYNHEYEQAKRPDWI